MSGPEIQANAIWTALHGVPLRSAPEPVELALIALLGMVAAVVRLRLRILAAVAVAAAVGLAYALAAKLAFDAGTILAFVAPLLTLVVGTVGMVVVSHLAETLERIRVARENEVLEAKVLERTEELRQTQLEVIRRLGQAAESRDEETGEHIERMSRMCQRLGVAAGFSEAEAELLRHATALHDVGKIGIPDRVLQKPGRFDAEEWAIMKTHTTIGASILAGSRSPLVQLAETVARTHHERWDGTGYPAGLEREEIPLAGRIAAICDVFDALVSARRYKEGWTLEDAVAEIRRQRGNHFEPRLVDLFCELAPELYAEATTEAPSSEPVGTQAQAPAEHAPQLAAR
jgi:response regulator RpfG family c-di-GMP phosphodiesterase